MLDLYQYHNSRDLIQEIIRTLKNIIIETEQNKKTELIKVLQNKIWSDESISDETLNEILSEVAYDLDFYEAKNHLRQESYNLYDDDRLIDIVRHSISKIEKYFNVF